MPVKISQKEKLHILVISLSLIIIAGVVGNFISSFLLSGLCVIFSAFIWTVGSKWHQKKELRAYFMKAASIISLVAASTLVFAVIWSYIVLQDYFLNIFVMQYLYFSPVLIVFFGAFYAYSDFLSKSKIASRLQIERVMILCVGLSLFISVLLVAGSMYTFEDRADIYYSELEALSVVSDETKAYFHQDIVVFSELEMGVNVLTDDVQLRMQGFALEQDHAGWCISSDCLIITMERANYLVSIIVQQVEYSSLLEVAQEELDYLESEEFTLNYESLESYETVLAKQVDDLDFDFGYSEEEIQIENLLASEFSYDQVVAIEDWVNIGEGSATFGGMFLEIGDFGYTSKNVISRLFTHSDMYKELVIMIANVMLTTSESDLENGVYFDLYSNIDIEESTTSKIIRYRLLLDHFDNLEVIVE